MNLTPVELHPIHLVRCRRSDFVRINTLSGNVMIGPPKLTRFERARIAGARALQVSLGAPILVELPQRVSDPIDIALAELNEGVLPMTIRRTLPDGSHQDIALVDLR